MKDNIYRNAVDHLQFSEDLEHAVVEKAGTNRPRFRVFRLAAIAAVLCVLFGTTAFAAEHIVERVIRIREVGRIRTDFSNAEIMEFSISDNMGGVETHDMELKPKGYYQFGEGFIFHPTEGFLRVTEDYQLDTLEYRSLDAHFEKNGRSYELNMDYIEADGGIYSNNLSFYQVKNDEILVNMTAKGSHGWPVYVNIKTGDCRDALPEFTEADFLPEKLTNGYEARISYSQPYRDGIIISCLVSGTQSGKTDSRSLLYWIQEGSEKAIKLDLPKNFIDDIINDTLYYQDSVGNIYVMDEQFQSQKIEHIEKSTDNLSCGLLTVCNEDGTLEIVDVSNQAIYHISNVEVANNSLWDTTGYNATRHSLDGEIVVTHSYNDYEANNRPLDSIAYLDMSSGELRQLHIDTDYHVQTHGWLDDDRYCVIYEDGLKWFLRIYEFED